MGYIANEDKVLTEFSTLILKHLLADFDEDAIKQFKEVEPGSHSTRRVGWGLT